MHEEKSRFYWYQFSDYTLVWPTSMKAALRVAFLHKRTSDLERGARIKTTGVAVVFTASGEVFLTSEESGSARGEFRKRVTEAELLSA